MVEALIAFVIAVLLVFAFTVPAWLAKLYPVGSIMVILWLAIMVIEWVFGKIGMWRTPHS